MQSASVWIPRIIEALILVTIFILPNTIATWFVEKVKLLAGI